MNAMFWLILAFLFFAVAGLLLFIAARPALRFWHRMRWGTHGFTWEAESSRQDDHYVTTIRIRPTLVLQPVWLRIFLSSSKRPRSREVWIDRPSGCSTALRPGFSRQLGNRLTISFFDPMLDSDETLRVVLDTDEKIDIVGIERRVH